MGIIGSRVTVNLRKAGYLVLTWSRTPRTEPDFLSSPLEVAKNTRIIQIFVANGQALHEVVAAMEPALTPEHIILNHATIAPEEVRRVAEMVGSRKARFVDAPFTGSRDAAAAGQIVFIVGGDPDTLEAVRPILEINARQIVPVGGIGDAMTVKIAANLLIAVTTIACAESLALLSNAGIPLQRFSEMLRFNGARSPIAEMKIPPMILDHFETHFALKHMLKDIRIALSLAAEHNTSLPTAEAFVAQAERATEKGWSDADYSVIARLLGFPDSQASLDEEFRNGIKK